MKNESIIQNLNLKPLNILSITDMKHSKKEGVEKWTCETEIANIKCTILIFSRKEYIRVCAIPVVLAKDTIAWLKKVNQVNGESLGLGAFCRLDEKDNFLAVATMMGDVEMNPPEFVIRLLNNAILEIPKMLKELLA